MSKYWEFVQLSINDVLIKLIHINDLLDDITRQAEAEGVPSSSLVEVVVEVEVGVDVGVEVGVEVEFGVEVGRCSLEIPA